MDGGETHKYSTGDGNLAKIIIDILMEKRNCAF
jgi:hypothetical protein